MRLEADREDVLDLRGPGRRIGFVELLDGHLPDGDLSDGYVPALVMPVRRADTPSPPRTPPDDFYRRIKCRLHERIGRELRLAGRVLDLGCGSCDLVEYLAETYRQKVIGIDISPGSFPPKRHTHGGVRFRCLAKDATHIDSVPDGSVDAVVTMWALHEMRHPRAILREAFRVLRPGGKMLVVDFPRGSLAQKLWDEDYFTIEQLREMLAAAGFDAVRARLIERGQIAWADGHKPPAGTAAGRASEERAESL